MDADASMTPHFATCNQMALYRVGSHRRFLSVTCTTPNAPKGGDRRLFTDTKRLFDGRMELFAPLYHDPKSSVSIAWVRGIIEVSLSSDLEVRPCPRDFCW